MIDDKKLQAIPEMPEAPQTAEATPTPEPAAEPKKGRGRPRKDGKPKGAPYTRNRKKKKPEPSGEATETPPLEETPGADSDLLKDLDSFVQQPSETPTPEAPAEAPAMPDPTPEVAPASEYISGYVLLMICDFIFPFGISVFFTRVLKRKIDADKLQLTGKEFSKLEPLADAAARQISVQISPLSAFALALASVYGGKALAMAQPAGK